MLHVRIIIFFIQHDLKKADFYRKRISLIPFIIVIVTHFWCSYFTSNSLPILKPTGKIVVVRLQEYKCQKLRPYLVHCLL